MVSQKKEREDWSTATGRQRELADILAADLGNSRYRVIDARNEQAYLERLASLKREEARELAKAEENLAKIAELDKQGKYAEAIPLAEAAVKTQQRLLGESNAKLAERLLWLGYLLRVQGDYARAEPPLRQALAIRKKALGENHPDYAASLDNLASLYWAQGDYARAEPLLRQALDICKKVLGENHPDYARSLNNLAALYASKGDYARAEPLHRQALEIRKKVLGENHPDYAASLSNLAFLYKAQGDYAKAEPLYRQTLEIRKKVLGENHPDYAASLNNLAVLYKAQGDYAQAEPLYRQALEIQGKVLGKNHPEYFQSLGDLAELYRVQGDNLRAEPLLRQAVTIQCKQLEDTAVIQSERQQLAMLETVQLHLHRYLTLAASKDQFSTPAYRLMLAWKGMVFRRQRLARAGEQTPELAALFRQLQQVAGQLATLAWATPDPKHADRWRESIAQLSEKKERLEAELSAQSAAFRQARAPSTLEDVRASLPKDVTLIDFLDFNHLELVALPQRGGLGVRFDQTVGGAKVTEVVVGGAAAQDGRLQPGDLILEITDQAGKWAATAGKSLQGVRDLMLGSAASKVSLRIRRGEEKELRELTLTRAPLPFQNKFEWKRELETVAFVVRHDRPVVQINLGPAKPVSEAIDAWRQTCGMSPQSAAAGRLLREKIWEPIAAQIQGAKDRARLSGRGPEQAAAGGFARQGSGQIPDRRIPAGHRSHGADDPRNRPQRNAQTVAREPVAGGQYRLRQPVRSAVSIAGRPEHS
jgi:tetratricopeptide (TPR) repeat protein